MRGIVTGCLLVLGLAVVSLAAILGPATPACAKRPPKFDEDLAIYLGCGEINGPGEVIQVDATGRILGRVKLPATPSGLVALENGLVGVLPSGGPDRVVRIDAAGKSHRLLTNRRVLPHPISVTVRTDTGEILVGDNMTDRVVALSVAGDAEPRSVLEIDANPRHLQCLSLAWGKDGHLLLGQPGPDGAYRVRLGPETALTDPLVEKCYDVAADATSNHWVAGYMGDLTLLRGGRVIRRLEARSGAFAFGPKGMLFLASRRIEVLDIKRRSSTYHTLFPWMGGRINAVVVAKKMPWPEAAERAPAKAFPEIERQLVRGHAFLESGDAKAALAEFESAVARAPESGQAHHGLGLALKALGRKREAAAAFARAQQLGFTGD